MVKCTIDLLKKHCLYFRRLSEKLLLYGCEIWRLSSDEDKLYVAWNSCFRKIFNAFGEKVPNLCCITAILCLFQSSQTRERLIFTRIYFVIIILFFIPCVNWQLMNCRLASLYLYCISLRRKDYSCSNVKMNVWSHFTRSVDV